MIVCRLKKSTSRGLVSLSTSSKEKIPLKRIKTLICNLFKLNHIFILDEVAYLFSCMIPSSHPLNLEKISKWQIDRNTRTWLISQMYYTRREIRFENSSMKCEDLSVLYA